MFWNVFKKVEIRELNGETILANKKGSVREAVKISVKDLSDRWVPLSSVCKL